MNPAADALVSGLGPNASTIEPGRCPLLTARAGSSTLRVPYAAFRVPLHGELVTGEVMGLFVLASGSFWPPKVAAD